MPTTGKIRRAQFRHRQYYGDYQSYDKNRVGGPPQMRKSRRKVQGGSGNPLLVGTSYTVREVWDGQSLASPGRWAVEDRRCPEDPVWSEVARRGFYFNQRQRVRGGTR